MHTQFIEYAREGNILELNTLVTSHSSQIKDMVSADDFYAFREAATNGHLPVITRLIELVQDQVSEMLSARNFSAFGEAAAGGHLLVLELLVKLPGAPIQAMIRADDFYGFCGAAANGHIPVIDRLIELAPELMTDMLSARALSAFCGAAANGHLPVIDRLIELSPELMIDMLKARDFYAFRDAAECGNIEIINRLMEIPEAPIIEMIQADNFSAFRDAAENCNLEIIARLMSVPQAPIVEMLSVNNFSAFRDAAENGNLEIIEQLMAHDQAPIVEMMRADNFGALLAAAENNHNHIIARLMTHRQAPIEDMLREDDFYIFRKAADNSDSSTMRTLLQYTPAGIKEDMVRSKNFEAFFIAAANGHLDIINLLDEDFQPLIKGMIAAENFRSFTEAAANGHLDIINRLIELASPDLVQQMISAEGFLAYNLAFENEDEPVIHRLLTFPYVSSYAAGQAAGLGLCGTASHKESSMMALTPGEEKRLGKAMAVYQPKVAERGVLVIMEDLKACMRAHYAKLPAMLTTAEGILMPLPIEFQEFAQERFSPADRAQALRSYYQHPVHSSYRYLSKPNLWMHPAAEYVHRDKDGRAWSTFEDFQELIALLYLAAIDEEAPPIDDYTIETRVEQFFIELALIGRAHNWDATDREEEYDDLEADQPSCPRGVRKRLLQSVKGHPLLRILTTDIVHHDVSRIVRTHFISRITDENCAALARDWSTVVNCESLASPSTLKILDFTQEEKDTHTHSLELSYGDLLDNELRKYLHSLFNNSNFKSLAEKFGGITDLGNLIAAQIRESSSKASSVASNGFFNQQLQAYAEAENDTRIKRPRND